MTSLRSRLAVALAGVCAIAVPAAAATADEAAAADVLFAEGRRLLAAGDVKAACPKFAESYRLDPALGALLNLASCHEKEGRVATAWSEYREAEAEAKRARDSRREGYSRKLAEALEPRLPRLTLTLSGATPGLSVTRNGVLVGEGSFGTELPVDPGPQAIEASAKGYKPWSTRVDITAGSHQSVTIPALDPEPIAAPPPPPPPSPPETSSALRPSGFVLGAVGVTALAVGGVFVGLTAGRKAAADPHCPDKVCDSDGAAAIASARTYAWAADISLGAGALLAAAGGVLIVLSLPGAKNVQVAPLVRAHGGGVAARVAF